MSEAILSYLQVQGGIMLNKKLAFIGAGAAAEAIIAGILRAKIVVSEQIIVTNRQNEDRLKELAKRYDVKYTTDASEAIQFADIILLAMKPYDLHDAIDSRNGTNSRPNRKAGSGNPCDAKHLSIHRFCCHCFKFRKICREGTFGISRCLISNGRNNFRRA